MRSIYYWFVLIVCFALIVSSCSKEDSSSSSTDNTTSSSGDSSDNSTSTSDNSTDLVRDSNLSCIAPSENPIRNSNSIQATFPNLPALRRLIGLYQSPGDSTRWYAMQQTGEVFWFENQTNVNQLNNFINLESKVKFTVDNHGILGLAFHPLYNINGEFFIHYIDKSGADNTTSTKVNLSLSATDNSSITGYFVSEDSTKPASENQGWTNVSGSTSYSQNNVIFTLSSASQIGSYNRKVFVWYKDSNGNVSASATDNITLIVNDISPPSNPSIIINSGASSTSNRDVNLFIAGEDNEKITDYYVSENSTKPDSTDSGWKEVLPRSSIYSQNVSFTLTSSPYVGSHNRTVYVWLKDALGNVSNSAWDSISLNIANTDVTAPSNPSITINNVADNTTSTMVNLTLSATDDSGITAFFVSEDNARPSSDNSAWDSIYKEEIAYSQNINFTLSSSSQVGNHPRTVYAWFKDAAGNISDSALDNVTLVITEIDTNYPTNPSIIINSGNSVISRFTNDGNLPVSLSTEEVILRLNQPLPEHNGGHLAFGPDGYLYIGFGDGGGGRGILGNAQDTLNLHGSILRLIVDNTSTYSIPTDNPFIDDENVLDEIYAYGLRNPWRWSFDIQSGELWAGDVGDWVHEEVDIIESGDNLGWPIMEGFHCFDNVNPATPKDNCDMDGLKLPVTEYKHGSGDCSITGGYVYRGQKVNSLIGQFIYGDFCTGRIFGTARVDNQTFDTQEINLSGLTIASFGQGIDGEVYILNYLGNAGEGIFNFTKAPDRNIFPTKLSETGCFESTQNKTYVGGVVPYKVKSQLWSDGVEKTRFFAIPDQTSIDVLSDGDFDFPRGSTLIKNFFLNEKFIETRIFYRHLSGWGGYSYRWLEDQSDAILLEDSEIVLIGNFKHKIPSRGQCFLCHTNSSHIVLGPESSQLDFDFQYPNGKNENQLMALKKAGYFSTDTTLKQMSKLAGIDDISSSIMLRARSYLHVNCGVCHRPGGSGYKNDFRIQTKLKDMMACDVKPNSGDLGITNARIIAPGDSSRSIMLARMKTLDTYRMPPLASDVVDQEAVSVIEQWIDSLTSCN